MRPKLHFFPRFKSLYIVTRAGIGRDARTKKCHNFRLSGQLLTSQSHIDTTFFHVFIITKILLRLNIITTTEIFKILSVKSLTTYI